MSSLYTLKALCAFAVVAIHSPVGDYRVAVNTLATLAVPLFMMITGYFLYHTDGKIVLSRIQGSIKKLLIIIALTHAVYAFLPHSGFPIGKDWDFYLRWLLTGVNHNNFHLWYLHSLLGTLTILWLIHRVQSRRWIPLALLGVPTHYYLANFVFSNSDSSYWHSIGWHIWRYTIATGLAFVCLGYLIKHYEHKIREIKHWGLSVIALIILMYLCQYTQQEHIRLILQLLKPFVVLALALSIFSLCLSKPDRGMGTCLAYVGEHLSSNIYYWHILVLSLVSHHLQPTIYEDWGIFYTFVLSAVLAYLIKAIQTALRIKTTL